MGWEERGEELEIDVHVLLEVSRLCHGITWFTKICWSWSPFEPDISNPHHTIFIIAKFLTGRLPYLLSRASYKSCLSNNDITSLRVDQMESDIAAHDLCP